MSAGYHDGYCDEAKHLALVIAIRETKATRSKTLDQFLADAVALVEAVEVKLKHRKQQNAT